MSALSQLENLPYTFSPSQMRWGHHSKLTYFLKKYNIKGEDVLGFLRGKMTPEIEQIHPGMLLHVGGLWLLPCVRFGDVMKNGKENEMKSTKQSIELFQAGIQHTKQTVVPSLLSELLISLAFAYFHIGNSHESQTELLNSLKHNPDAHTEKLILQLMSCLPSYCSSEWLPLLTKYSSTGGCDLVRQIWSSPKCQQIIQNKYNIEGMLHDPLSRTIIRSAVIDEELYVQFQNIVIGHVIDFLTKTNKVDLLKLFDELTTVAIQSAITGWISGDLSDNFIEFETIAKTLSNSGLQTTAVIELTKCLVSCNDHIGDVLSKLDTDFKNDENIKLMSQYFHYNLDSEIQINSKHISVEVEIDDHILQSFYDKNPYPVWSAVGSLGLQKYDTCYDFLSKYLPRSLVGKLNSVNNETILVAGCGSGHQVALSLEQYANSNVTGVDLSKVNLCYAAKRMRQLQYNSNRYSLIHGDINNLTDSTYDVIECCGVLHHCKDEVATLKNLTNCLRIGGVMFLGVYAMHSTEPVRGAIEYLRNKYNFSEGYHPTINEIRIIRNDIQSLPRSSKIRQALMSQQSYYSTPAFRDMVFHPRASYHSIDSLKSLVEKISNLSLLAFQFDTTTSDISNRLAYSNISPSDEEMINWDTWKKIEGKAMSQNLPWHHIILQRVK